MPVLLLRPPPTTLAQGVVTHIADQRGEIDYAKAHAQWNAYADVFRQHGWHIIEVGQDNALPDSVFVEDGIISVDRISPEHVRDEDKATQLGQGLLILASPGNAAREGEPAGIEEAIKAHLGSLASSLRRIERPGTLDGGDILKVPALRTIYIGESARTNAEGILQMQTLCEPLGWKVCRVPVVKALHLKSMLTALPDGTIIGYEPLLEDAGVFESFIGVNEPEGVAVVHLSAAKASKETPLLMSASAPLTTKMLRNLGYSVVTTPIGEYEKLEGCVTCLSVRIRHA